MRTSFPTAAQSLKTKKSEIESSEASNKTKYPLLFITVQNIEYLAQYHFKTKELLASVITNSAFGYQITQQRPVFTEK